MQFLAVFSYLFAREYTIGRIIVIHFVYKQQNICRKKNMIPNND